VAGLQTCGAQAPQLAPQPAPSPHTPMPPTGAEFVQHVVAGLQTGDLPSPPLNSPNPSFAHPASNMIADPQFP
jgi:hypothetical protein